ncbi:glucooligosaccharide oxidase [Amanita muscaria]
MLKPVLVSLFYHLNAVSRAENLRSPLNSEEIHAVFPGDCSFTEASAAYNRRITVKPAAITFPINVLQVAHIVKTAAAGNYRVVAKSGGHSYTANGLGGTDGAIVIDLRNMTKTQVFWTGSADIETGNTLGNVAAALIKNSRAIPHGTCPYVGIGGHAGYGGYGFTSRMWGLTLDTILSMTVVLADGIITTISEEANSDLFWAMRGAIGSYGIVTSFNIKTFPAPTSATVFNYLWYLHPTQAAQAVSAFQEFAQTDIPKEFGPQFAITAGPTSGLVSLTLLGGWYGPAEKLDVILAPYLADLPKPDSVNLVIGSYIESVEYLGARDSAPAHHFYRKSIVVPESSPFSGLALNAFMTFAANEGFRHKPDWRVLMGLYGGNNSAINAVPPNATAFSKRNILWTVQFSVDSSNPQVSLQSSDLVFLDNVVDSLVRNSPPDCDYGACLNYIDDRQGNWKELYYGAKYADLMRIKQKYDPDNVFSFPMGVGCN